MGATRARGAGARAEDLEEHPERLADRSYRSDLVLTLCGALFTTYTSEVTDDAAAATWALGVVDDEHRAVVQRAVHATADPLPVAATRAFVWEVHRLVGAEVLRQRE